MNNLITITAGRTHLETNSPTLARHTLEFVTGLDPANNISPPKTGTWLLEKDERVTSDPAQGAHLQIGEFWKEQGGIYAGIMRGVEGKPDYYLIVSEKEWGQAEDIQWGDAGEDVEEADCQRDGRANTTAILESAGSHPAAEFTWGVSRDNHADWYLPSRRELALCYTSVPEQFDSNWYWSSTQYSPTSAWNQDFDDGLQGYVHKDFALLARAVRRFIINSTI